MFERISGRIALLGGWSRYGLAFLAGALAAFAQAPYHVFPVLWISLPVFVWLLDGAVEGGNRGRIARLMPAFRIGWAFGFGYFLNGLWWVGEAFLVDADRYAWAMPFAVIMLPAGLGLYHGLAGLLARAFWTSGPSRIAVLSIAWTLCEYARGHLFTGFPWNDLGYGLAANLPMMQVASLVGLPGLTLPAVLIFGAPAALDGRAAGRRFVLAAMALLIAITGFGFLRLSMAGHETVAGVRMRIMQPAVTEWSKWRPDERGSLLTKYVDLSNTSPDGLRSGLSGITHLIWPESPFSFLLAREPWALATIADMVRQGPTVLITGAVRAEPAQGSEKPRFYNSIYVIGSDGEITGAYDKSHLVPFGEYVPLEPVLDLVGFKQLTQIKSAFTSGPGPRTLAVPGAPPAGMMICYEAVFPGEVIEPGNRPRWLVNVTNDAWFGMSPGPYQHLFQAQMRAVEEGLPIVRAANSGVSAMIDPYGRLVNSLALGKVGSLDIDLPMAIDPPFYVTIRNYGMMLELIVMSLLTLWVNLPARRIHG